jgi:Holliday junction resolvasome RuvABC DNA-binding subunit
MNLQEYIKSQLSLHKHPDLEMIYQDLMNLGFKPKEIFKAINKQIEENISKAIEDYLKKKNEKLE